MRPPLGTLRKLSEEEVALRLAKFDEEEKRRSFELDIRLNITQIYHQVRRGRSLFSCTKWCWDLRRYLAEKLECSVMQISWKAVLRMAKSGKYSVEYYTSIWEV